MADKCWVLLNDNGGTNNDLWGANLPQFGPKGALGAGFNEPRYSDSSMNIPIPQILPVNKFNFVYGSSTNANDFDCVESGYTQAQSRLWAYDIADNKAHYVGSMPTEGSDIGMGNSTFTTGCEYGLTTRKNIDTGNAQSCSEYNSSYCKYTNLTLNQYSYNFSDPSSATSFSRIALKTYRVVTDAGQLIGVGNSTTQTNTTSPSYGHPDGVSLLGTNYLEGHAGIGNAIGYISDTEVLVDDRAGNIWYVKLDNYYMGSNVWSSENPNFGFGQTPHANVPGTYTQLTEPAIGVWPGPGHVHNLENGWAVCSQLTNNRVYTVIGKKVIDLNWPSINVGGNLQPVRTQGDLTFVANDASQGNQPTVSVTVNNGSMNTTLMPSSNVVVKYPIDLSTFIVQTTPFAQLPANPITQALQGNHTTPSASVAIVKEPTTDNYYLISKRKRYLAAIDAESADISGQLFAPLNVDSQFTWIDYRFWFNTASPMIGGETFESPNPSTGLLPSATGNGSAPCTTNIQQLNFRGGSQPPDCVFPSSYSYDCTITGCESLFTIPNTTPLGQFATLEACTGECRSYSCNTVNYSCNEIPGTGATNTYLDIDDCDEFCIPPYYDCTDDGCIPATVASHQYTSLNSCEAVCVSHNCNGNGCYPQNGTGGTFTNFATCTASCFSYVCGDDGAGNPTCTLFNPPYYGTGGTFTAATLAAAYTACTAATATSVCTSWSCNNEGTVAPNTDIYVYYDSTSMSFGNTKIAHNAMMDWTATIPDWTGNIYHINMSDERWVSWAGIPYQQPTPRGLKDWTPASLNNNGAGYNSSTCTPSNQGNCIPRIFQVTAWGQSGAAGYGNGANWYDGWDPAMGNIYISSGSLAGTYQFRGYPPYAGGSFVAPDYSIPVLNVLFTDESDFKHNNVVAVGGNEFGNTQIYYQVDRISNPEPTWAATGAAGVVEPTQPFTNDYNYWIGIWNAISLNNGSVANFVYPTKPNNYYSWGSGTRMVFKHQALSVLAAISSGNQTIPDGTWLPGTAPRMASAGGASGSVPGICSIANLTQLETSNVYWAAGFGGLDQYGFGYNVEFPVINQLLVQNDLEGFLTGGSTILATGCTSAATSTSIDYPYTSRTECLDFCDPKWECTDTGCILNSTGGTFDSYSACTGGTVMMVSGIMTDVPGCQSWSCTTVGCETYNSPLLGTGGTYTVLNNCYEECTSWQCDYVPSNLMWSADGCVEYIGTGQTYSAESACTASCISWDCHQTQPCTEYPNTAHTHNDEAACLASNNCGGWFQCQLSGCIAQPGAFVSGPNNYATEQECIDVCVGWGCDQSSISNDTNIYVFYDTSSLPLVLTQNIHNSVMAWVNAIPGHTGDTYHTAIDDERWLDWGRAVFTGSTSLLLQSGLQTPSLLNNAQTSQLIQWGATTAQAAYWYDNQVPGTNTILGLGSVTSKGTPPVAAVSGNTLILCFIDEADGVTYINNGTGRYHNGAGVINNIPVFSGGTVTAEYQPTSAWDTDYGLWTTAYQTITASTGTTLGFVYPISLPHHPNQHHWSTDITFALQVAASITEGDQPVKDGTFSASTYPRTAASGGVSGGVPPLCGIADLQTLSYTNPYYSGGSGNLQAKGWGYNIEYTPFNSQVFQNDLGRFLAQNNNSVSAGAGGTCLSAETLWNTSITHPYSCETCTTANQNCCDCNCTPSQQLYTCTYTGCALSSVGTLTWDQCNNPNYEHSCKSWSCSTDNGCLNYNYPNPQMLVHNGLISAPVGTPYPNPLGGTGGTFTQLGECYRLCSSFNCVWDPINMSINQDGCLQQIGSGGTYYNELQQTLGTDASYSACTGECQSYECNSPCGTVSYPIPLIPGNPAPPLNPITGCTQYPNTGSTHLTEITCTASCEEHWYCYTGAGQTFNANCLNATSTGISNVSFEGQISAIANNPTWQTTSFGNLRWDMTGNYYNPTPTQPGPTLPLPMNPCKAPIGHWARITSISISVLSLTYYYTWETFIDDCNTLAFVNPPLPYSSVWQDVINQVGPHIYCQWEWCECETEDCKIGCIDELPLPPQTHGSYTSSTATTEVCCTGATATTWSCQTTTEANTCDGLTLIPNIYPTTLDAYNYMAINLGTNTFSGYHYESVAPPLNTTDCSGPNGGQLFKLTGITLSNSNIQTNNYTSWATFITALASIPAPDGPILGLTVGMPAATIETQIQTYSAFCSSYIQYGKTECICTNTPCNCIELIDGTGAYTSQTHCQEVCCNSGTSWDCQNGIAFQPNCLTKDYIGMYNSDVDVLDYFRVNSATTQFGLSKVAVATPFALGINPLSWAQVQTAMGTAWNWMDCYFNLPGTTNFYPYKYVANIHHPGINGGFKYNTWQSFSGAVTTAGVTFNSTDTVATVCSKIGNQLGGATACKMEVFNCCRDESCYCYELFAPGGLYTNEPDCLTVCCPVIPYGWECTMPTPPATIGICSYVPYGLSLTWQDCIIDCTGTTSWNCVPGIEQEPGVDSQNCGAGKIEMNPGVAMDGFQAIMWAINVPSTDWGDMYYLTNSSFGMPTNACIDPVTGYFYRVDVRFGWACPGGIYDHSQMWNWVIFTWNDMIDYFNTTYQNLGNGSQPTPNPFYLGMTEVDIFQMMRDTDPGWGTTWEVPGGCFRQLAIAQGTCKCIVTDCDCVEIPGNTGQYPTYTLCIPPCCQVPTVSYDCTINGCIDPGGGYGHFQGVSALVDCEAVCWEWACNNQNISSNCANLIALEFFGNLQYLYGALGLTNTQPRTNVNINNTGSSSPYWPANTMWEWAQAVQPGNVIIDFFGGPETLGVPYGTYLYPQFLNTVTSTNGTVPCSNPGTPGCVYNMQFQDISNYKMDTTIIGPESVLTGTTVNNYCSSPNGKWWRPTGIGVVDRTSGAVLITPQLTWYALIKLLVVTYPDICTQMGFPAGTPNPQPCIEDMLGVQPHEINFHLLGTPLGFLTLNGEFRLYGEGCVC